VESDTALLGQGAESVDEVNEPVRVITGAADDRDRVVVHEISQGVDIDHEGIREGSILDLDAHPVRSLAQGDVRGHR